MKGLKGRNGLSAVHRCIHHTVTGLCHRETTTLTMLPAMPQDHLDLKVEAGDHIEDHKVEQPEPQPSSRVLVSGLAVLNTRQAMKRFWRLLLIGFSVSVSGMYVDAMKRSELAGPLTRLATA